MHFVSKFTMYCVAICCTQIDRDFLLCCLYVGGKGENREVVVATEDFVSAMLEHLSFSEVIKHFSV